MHHNSTKTTLVCGLALFAVLFLTYARLPSQQRNMDGPLQDIASITTGVADASSRHLLYTYVGVPYYRMWRALGYPGDAAYPMILLNAFCAALGICGFFLFLRGVGSGLFWAILLALAYAFSYGYWAFTTDANYNILAIVPLLWSLPILLKASRIGQWPQRSGLALLLALLGALAILATQEHALFVPVVVIGLLTSQTQVSPKDRGIPTIVYLSGLFTLLLLAFVSRAIQVNDCTSVRCVIAWLRPYSELLPMYGGFTWDRAAAAPWSFLASVVPLWRGMALRSLVRGIITPNKLLPQLALLFTLLVLGAAGVTLIRQRVRVWRDARYLVVLCVGWLMIYIPPIIWLDPYGPERWIVPMVPVLTLIAVAVNLIEKPVKAPYRFTANVAAIATVALIASANLTQEIWPNYSIPNHDIAAARVASSQMMADDIIISPKWDWTAYLATEDRRLVSLLELSMQVAGRKPDPQRLLTSLDSRIREVKANGGRVFLVDVFGYTSADWDWIEQNTGLRLEHLAKYSRVPAWQFDGEQIWEILGPAQN